MADETMDGTSQQATRPLWPPPPPPPPPFPSASLRRSSIPALPPYPGKSALPVSRPSPMQQKLSAIPKSKLQPPHAHFPFQPCYMFFYGSLMDAEVLQAILGLKNWPAITKAKIAGFKIKMWGIYPALITCDGAEVCGTAYWVEHLLYFRRLLAYETFAYTWCACTIEFEDGRTPSEGRTFCWAGDADSNELTDGAFELQRYQKYFKPSVLGKSPVD